MPGPTNPQSPTAKELVILLAMRPGQAHTAGGLARGAWKRPTTHYVTGPQQGQNQSMGAALARMEKKGLVMHILSDTLQRRWYLTGAGMKAREAALVEIPKNHTENS